jgi:glycyl-tRNA synthetase beta chain
MKDRADFLFEIGCEEIPAGMLPAAIKELQVILQKHLDANNLSVSAPVITYGAPRRLAAMCSALLTRQPDQVREITGPPKSVAYDDVGRPTRAAESFAQKQGVPLAQLYLLQTPRGECLAFKQVTKGRPAIAILQEVLPKAISEIPWPRSMYWTGIKGPRFIRPVRWIVALLGGRVIHFSLGAVASGDTSAGHRFLGKAKIKLRGSKDYVERLRANFSLVRPEDRRRKIESELHGAGGKGGVKVHADTALMEQVVYLNEYPKILRGEFDPAFLELPKEILITVMRGHQKYFALDRRDGTLAPGFLAVINQKGDHAGVIRAGHERVLRARFADARFFWESDQKCRLADYLPKLNGVTFQEKLGSYGQKIERVRALARWVAELWFAEGIHEASVGGVDRAAELAKCDLVTEMVREFPELQGVVGGLYAEAQGEPAEVSHAVYDQYLPAGLDDEIPRNLTGCALALADKLDSLVGCSAAGLVPTGSSDPFALRRATLGIVKIIIERKLPFSLSAAISKAASILAAGQKGISAGPEVERAVTEFLLDRARYAFKERWGFAYDEVNAVLAADADDLVDARQRIEAVRAIRKTKDFEPLAISFKRIRKILEKAGPSAQWKLPAVQAELFAEPAERGLYEAAVLAAKHAEEDKRSRRYRQALERIAGLRPKVDLFFERVMVMAEDAEVRKNRLTLLSELLTQFSTIADFSEIAPSERG